jgi:hypothetical protein
VTTKTGEITSAVNTGPPTLLFQRALDGTTTRIEVSGVAFGQFMEVTGQLYEFNNACGANLISLG